MKSPDSPSAKRPPATFQYRLGSLFVVMALFAIQFGLCSYFGNFILGLLLTAVIIWGAHIWMLPKTSTSLTLAVLMLGYVVGQLGVKQVIMGSRASSYLCSVDKTGWRLTRLSGTRDPLLQYKTGSNRAGRWERSFDHPNRISLFPGCVFRQGGHLWHFGIHHFLAIAFGFTLVFAAYRQRGLSFLHDTFWQIPTDCQRLAMIHIASTPDLRDIPQLSLARPSGGSG